MFQNAVRLICVAVIPIIIQKTEKSANIFAFIHWVVIGLIIAEISTLPILLIVVSEDKKVIIPITVMSALLGSGVGAAGAYFMV